MKFLKRTIATLLVICTLFLLFKGMIYRKLFYYKSIGQREITVTVETELQQYIKYNTQTKNPVSMQQAIKLALKITSDALYFSGTATENNPNKLIKLKAAHCVGYSAFFSTTLNYLLQQNNLNHTWRVKHNIGQIYLLNKNIHVYFSSAFFKDHDFVSIENYKTGEIIAVDPSVNDYFGIDVVKKM